MSSSGRKLILHKTIESIRFVRQKMGASVGFVPTMGALHEGHLSLIRTARKENDFVIASVFVNPTQFAPGEDLDKYPRQLEQDTDKLTELGVDHLFAPHQAELYGPHHVTYVEPTGFDEIAEGRSRPGHFRGVATIVTKLFNIIQPTNAYFGQKDAAQCVLIRRITRDLNMNVNVVIRPTIREDDGLAMSSRNAYLNEKEREAAPVVYRALCTARDYWQERSAGTVDSDEICQRVRQVLSSEPLVSEIQYVAVDSGATMQPMTGVSKEEGAIVSLACKIGSVRLIDNIRLE